MFHHRNSEFDASVTYLFDCREKREDKIYLLFLGRVLFCFFFCFYFLNDMHTHGLRLPLETLENVAGIYLSYLNVVGLNKPNHTRC